MKFIYILDQMHNLNSYVRDFYFFRRNFYPQLSLVHMDPEEAYKALQRQVRWRTVLTLVSIINVEMCTLHLIWVLCITKVIL